VVSNDKAEQYPQSSGDWRLRAGGVAVLTFLTWNKSRWSSKFTEESPSTCALLERRAVAVIALLSSGGCWWMVDLYIWRVLHRVESGLLL
jgi:hypothetical protein